MGVVATSPHSSDGRVQLEKKHMVENFEEEGYYEEETLEKKHMVENTAEERVQLVDFEEKEG
jgi:hypothetical protein